MTSSPSSDRYLAAALELFDELGPADPSLGITADAAAQWGGITRASIYRHWGSVSDANHDAACFIVANEGWPQRFLAQPVDRPMGAALAASLAHPGVDLSMVVRVLAAGWSEHVETRRWIREYEAAWIEQFTGWIEAHCAATGRTHRAGSSASVTALALLALIEGRQYWHLLRVAQHDGSTPDAPSAAVPIPELAQRLLDHVTAPEVPQPRGSAEAWAAVPLPTPVLSPGKARLGRQFIASLRADPSTAGRLPEPGRLVDVGRIARRLDVANRSVYAMWPTTADQNRALLTAVFARERAAIDTTAEQAFEIGLDQRYTTFESLLISGLQAIIRSSSRPHQSNYFAATQAVFDPAVAHTVVELIDEWRSALQILILAAQAMSHSYRHPDITAKQLTDTLVESVIGLQRLTALHPELLDATIEHNGEDHPACGIALWHIAGSLAADGPPHADTTTVHRAAPPLPPDPINETP